MITNADTGAVFGWAWERLAYCAVGGTDSGCTNPVDAATESHLTTTAGGAVASDVIITNDGVQPVLQLADGSFVGVGYTSGQGAHMMAFDTSGNVKWTVPGDYPQYYPKMLTADGSIVTNTGLTFDATTGLATGQLASLPEFQSWIGKWLQLWLHSGCVVCLP